MSSPFTSFEDNSSIIAESRDSENFIDRAINGLEKCLQLYEEKARNIEVDLEILGCTFKDLPENLRSDLKDAFKDDEGVFSFTGDSSRKMVRINGEHVLDSLQQTYEQGQLRLLASQMETVVEEYSSIHASLYQKLNTGKEESEKLENKRFDKEVKVMTFKGKLEMAKKDLETLQQLSQSNQKPKYSYDDIDNLKEELNKLRSEVAYTNTKLKKYNKLPLNDKDVLKQMLKMREELKHIDNEIRNKVSC